MAGYGASTYPDQSDALTQPVPEEEDFAYASARDHRKLFARRRPHGKK